MEKNIEKSSSSKLTSRFGTCSKDCYGACVFSGLWDDSNQTQPLQKTIPLKNHPFTQGTFCAKNSNRIGSLYHPSRLKHPLIRINEKPCPVSDFKPISMEEAWNTLIQKILKVYQKHGPEKILAAFYSGNTGLLSQYFPLRFFHQIDALVTNGGICNEGGCAGLRKIFGTYSLSHPLQILNSETNLIVIWNSDLSNNNNHAHMLVRKAQQRGVKLVVIDSRRTRIAEQADYFYQIPLNTSHLFSLVIIREIMKKGAANMDFLHNFVKDGDEIIKLIENLVSDNTFMMLDLTQNDLEEITSLFIENMEHTLFMIGYGTQKDRFGGYYVQIIALLQIILGNIGKPGAGIIYSLSDHRRDIKNKIIHNITPRSCDYFAIEDESLNIIKLADILKEKDIKLLIIYNFNPASSLPNQAFLREQLKRKDLYVVVLDCFPNETMAFADLVFPMKMSAETHDLISSYYMPGLSIIQAGPCPYPDCMSNHEFFNHLGIDIGTQLGWSEDILKSFQISSEEIIDRSLQVLEPEQRKNILNHGYTLFFKPEEIFYRDMIFPTPSGKIELESIKSYLTEFHHTAVEKIQKDPDELFLYTPHHPRFLHSQLGEINPKFHSDFFRAFMNPRDIDKFRLEVGERVKIYNKIGEGIYEIAEMDSLKEGMILIYSGGPNRHPLKPNANFFTDPEPELLGHSGSYFMGTVRLKSLN